MTISSNSTGCLVLALEGSLNADSLPEIGRLIKDGRRNRRPVALDLEEVTLLDRAAARFIAAQLKRGVAVLNCPVYIKQWIELEIHEKVHVESRRDVR